MMKKTKKQAKENGAALILVVVVTVLLAVIGVMFLMVSRVSEMETVAVADQQDLDAAVQTVTGRINEVLVEDLFGLRRPTVNDEYTYDTSIANANQAAVGTNVLNIYADEPYDYPIHNVAPGVAGVIGPGPDGNFDDTTNYDDVWLPGQYDDYWLASLEPKFLFNNTTPADPSDDIYVWPHITDLWGSIQGTDNSLFYQQYDRTDHHKFFQQNLTRKQWIDPDKINVPTTWDTAAEWARWQVSAYNVEAKVIAREDRMDVAAIPNGGPAPATWDAADKTLYGARADADGDGVADSRWVPIPGLNSSRGKSIYAAVRIIDNCAMLNLNAASCFYQDPQESQTTNPNSFFKRAWYLNVDDFTATPNPVPYTATGRYLSEINYLPFLRGSDLFLPSPNEGEYWYNIQKSKRLYDFVYDLPATPQFCHNTLMNIENPGADFNYFDISDELEIRNRFLITSDAKANFENAAYYTFDSAGGTYKLLTTPVDDYDAFASWKYRIDPVNFDKYNPATFNGTLNGQPLDNRFKYDRRHVCTFYSYDRNLRHGQYPRLTTDVITVLSAPSFTPPTGYTLSQYETALWKVFTPEGAVTTNIQNTNAAQSWNNLETRKRILQLLYALRDYYMVKEEGLSKHDAALKAAQIVANIIDYSDDDAANDDSSGNADGKTDTQGPFYRPTYSVNGHTIDYGKQANKDCTFLTEAMIDQMLFEVSNNELGTGKEVDVTLAKYAALAFGLNTTDIVFGYERQPFISEIYARWDGSQPVDNALLEFAIELVNPYSDKIAIDGWKLRVGDGTRVDHDIPSPTVPTWFVPEYDTTAETPGRMVFESDASVFSEPGGIVPYPPVTELTSLDSAWFNNEDLQIQLLRPAPAWVKTNLGISYIAVDHISSNDVRSILGNAGDNALKRDDHDWKFAQAKYEIQRELDGSYTTDTLGLNNDVTLSGNGFQLAVADDGYPVSRWHDLEVMSLFGNGPDTGDPNDVVSVHITDAANAGDAVHFDLAGASEDLLDYLCTMNRPDEGTLPGRININTAPVHVIAAAIPPVLADPNAADSTKVVAFSALDLAEQIVANRPYKKLSDLLKISRFKEYTTGGAWADENVGAQSIENDIEERDWILSNLANKFTVRSDVFTAYILVRLGEDGPQRRMIAIFDRSNVWKPDDKPKLVALHPVPDPR